MSVMSPDGAKHARTIELNEKYASRDGSVGERGQSQRYQEVYSRDQKLGFELDNEANSHLLLDQPHAAGLLAEDAHQEPLSDAQEWERERYEQDRRS